MPIDIVGDYDHAYTRLICDALRGFWMSDQVLSKSPLQSTSHSGPIRNVSGIEPLDQPMQPLSYGAIWSADIDRNTDVDSHTAFIAHLAESRKATVTPNIFKSHGQIADAVGNSVCAGGKLTHDLIFEVLEKINVWFDDDGKYSLQITETYDELYIQTGSNGEPW